MLQRGESDTLPPSFVFALVEKDGQPAALAALYFHPGASEAWFQPPPIVMGGAENFVLNYGGGTIST